MDKRVRITEASTSSVRTSLGFLDLPQELVFHILDCFEDTGPLSDEVVRAEPSPEHLPNDFITRLEAMRRLSLVCRTLRAIFFPKAWEHLIACTSSGRGAWYKEVGNRLHTLCRVVIQSPEVANRVTMATISLSRYNNGEILPALAQCLGALPNLHTLRLPWIFVYLSRYLEPVFKDKSFPQIRRIFMSGAGRHILAACPNVEELFILDSYSGLLLKALEHHSARRLRVVDGFLVKKPLIKRLARIASGLRVLNLEHRWFWDKLSPDEIACAAGFHSLERLELRWEASKDVFETDHRPENSAQAMAVARNILQQSQAPGPKVAALVKIRRSSPEAIFELAIQETIAVD